MTIISLAAAKRGGGRRRGAAGGGQAAPDGAAVTEDWLALQLGSAQWLGCAERDPLQGDEDVPLRLASTPLAWLAAPDSVCVLDWSAATVARLCPFGDGAVVCDDVATGERLQRLLGRARLPQIGVELAEAA